MESLSYGGWVTWMSQEVSKWLVNGWQMGYISYTLLTNGIFRGYTPFTNHLLTSWDIQVELPYDIG